MISIDDVKDEAADQMFNRRVLTGAFGVTRRGVERRCVSDRSVNDDWVASLLQVRGELSTDRVAEMGLGE